MSRGSLRTLGVPRETPCCRLGDPLSSAAWWTPPGNCTKVLFLSLNKSRPPYLHSHCCYPGRETLLLVRGLTQWCHLVDTPWKLHQNAFLDFFESPDRHTCSPTTAIWMGTPCCRPGDPLSSATWWTFPGNCTKVLFLSFTTFFTAWFVASPLPLPPTLLFV